MSEGYVHTGLEPNSAVDIPDPTQFDPQTVELVMRRLVRDGGLPHMPKDLDACCALVKKAMSTPDYSNYKSMYENLTNNLDWLCLLLMEGAPPTRNRADAQPIYNKLVEAVYAAGNLSENLQKDVEYALEIGELDSADCAFLPRHTKLGERLLKHVVDIRTQAYTAAKATVALEYDVAIAIQNSGLNGPTGVYVPSTKTGERLYRHVVWLLKARLPTDELKWALLGDIDTLRALIDEGGDISCADMRTIPGARLRASTLARLRLHAPQEGARKEEKTAEQAPSSFQGGAAQQAVSKEQSTPSARRALGKEDIDALLNGLSEAERFFADVLMDGFVIWLQCKEKDVLGVAIDAASYLYKK